MNLNLFYLLHLNLIILIILNFIQEVYLFNATLIFLIIIIRAFSKFIHPGILIHFYAIKSMNLDDINSHIFF